MVPASGPMPERVTIRMHIVEARLRMLASSIL